VWSEEVFAVRHKNCIQRRGTGKHWHHLARLARNVTHPLILHKVLCNISTVFMLLWVLL
jgi:hypothetical protein